MPNRPLRSAIAYAFIPLFLCKVVARKLGYSTHPDYRNVLDGSHI